MANLHSQLPSQVFEHTQAVASASWVIVHNMGMYPIVDVFVDYQGESQKILPKSVAYTNPNTCTITFSVPLTGKATLS
jgi:3-oxoacyl-ACP reductase-like protein